MAVPKTDPAEAVQPPPVVRVGDRVLQTKLAERRESETKLNCGICEDNAISYEAAKRHMKNTNARIALVIPKQRRGAGLVRRAGFVGAEVQGPRRGAKGDSMYRKRAMAEETDASDPAVPAQATFSPFVLPVSVWEERCKEGHRMHAADVIDDVGKRRPQEVLQHVAKTS